LAAEFSSMLPPLPISSLGVIRSANVSKPTNVSAEGCSSVVSPSFQVSKSALSKLLDFMKGSFDDNWD
jgi:hypothetical protein